MKNKYEEWNKKQEELFELFFKENKEETVNIKDIVDSSKQVHEIWENLYKILKNDKIGFDDYSKIDIIKKINYKDKNYLILKLEIWEYIIIDLETKETLSSINAAKIFSEDFFISNFKEKKGYKPETFYDFCECDIVTTQEIINYYNKYENILSNKKKIDYSITDENAKTFLSIELSRLQIILGFQVFGGNSNVNYVFINKNLKPGGASNPTGNEKSLVKMGIRVPEIEVPKSLIPEYLLNIIEEIKSAENSKKTIKFQNKI